MSWFSRLATAACVLGTTPALAADWPKAFPSTATSSQHEARTSLIVVGVGAAGSESKLAAAALASALRTSGKLALVMGDEALGDVSALDDAAVVKRCAHLPVSHVAVVRVFDGAPGQPGTAVVTTYDKKGEVVVAYSTREDAPLEARAGASTASEGVTSNAAEAVASISKESSAHAEEYDKKFIGSDDFIAVNQYGATVATGTNFYQGKYKRPLDWPEFYNLVGDKQLAHQYNENLAARWLLIGGGTVVAVAAPLVWVGARESIRYPVAPDYPSYSSCIGSADYSKCMDAKDAAYNTQLARYETAKKAADAERDSYNPILYGGTGLGLVGLIVGLAWQLHPTTPEQARELADKYNKKLKQDLESGTPVQPTKTSVQMNVSGALLPGGGAMVLHGSF
jgi:hypothetical protein